MRCCMVRPYKEILLLEIASLKFKVLTRGVVRRKLKMFKVLLDLCVIGVFSISVISCDSSHEKLLKGSIKLMRRLSRIENWQSCVPDFKIKSINWEPVRARETPGAFSIHNFDFLKPRGSEIVSERKRNNLVSFFVDKIKTRPTRKRPISTTTASPQTIEPSNLVGEENISIDKNELQSCCNCQASDQTSAEIINLINSSSKKLTSLEAQTSELNLAINEIEFKLEQVNDQLSNIFEILKLQLPNGSKKKFAWPIIDTEPQTFVKLQVTRLPSQQNSTGT